MHRALPVILVLLAAASASAAPKARPQARGPAPSTAWKEVIEPGEQKVFEDFGREIQAIQDRTAKESGMPLDRAFHPKTHAVVTGELRVLDALPEICRQGVFKQPATYKCWIRFSNLKPQRQPDRNPDFRAIAVKVLNVPGAPLTPGVTSLDLMALNKVLQPARNIHQFIAFVRYSFNLLTFPVKLAAAIGVREATRMILWMQKNLGGRVKSLGSEEYWSTLPIQFGPYAVKYKFEPRNGAEAPFSVDSPTYLREELTQRLKKGALKWDLLVQFYVDPASTPIEDAVVIWEPAVTPFYKVGELTIAARDNASTAGVAEEKVGNKLLFNPWHAPAEHRPLGNLQRARRVGYPASGKHRGHTQP